MQDKKKNKEALANAITSVIIALMGIINTFENLREGKTVWGIVWAVLTIAMIVCAILCFKLAKNGKSE